MAGQKTSIYLTEQLKAAVEASGLTLPELIRRGLTMSGHPEQEQTEDAIRALIRDEIATADLPDRDEARRIARSEASDAIEQARGYS